ncbi:MAG: undecaprenyldiphospho-muramoylpentapeptide beta-N-acetylglucosaminyltransferase [Burkholderiaceae bacterium]|nr:undecaprenyldiphospho-muramoylpentapeptide beta-N-acetylglucosaminyltransferase [Burkholderiaceae bacterium]
MMARRVLIAAGGTGGHVFPALAVAQELMRRGWHAEWVGSDRGLEARVIPRAGIGLHILRFAGVRGKGPAAWLTLPLRLLVAIREASHIFGRSQPQVVVAFGGYVTFPVGLLAFLKRIPLCVHEQNAVMGTANRWLARVARSVMVSFPSTRFAPSRAILIGNPVREAIHALPAPAERYHQRTGPLRVLVIGGSLGAQALNLILPAVFAHAAGLGQKLQIRHQTGPRDLADVKADYQRLGISAECSSFIDDMDQAYAWADLLVCRAGASTVTEVAAAGVAALFVPLPHAIDDHQTANARYLADHQAAWIVAQQELSAASTGDWIAGLSRAQLMGFAQQARSCSMRNAADQAASLVESVCADAHRGESR